MIELYHGTNIDFAQIDLGKCRPNKDFGQGFYLTDIYEQARGVKMHDYDIVVGPVADDGVVFQLNLYMQHLISMETLVKELTFKHLNKQYFFGTQRAIDKLVRI